MSHKIFIIAAVLVFESFSFASSPVEISAPMTRVRNLQLERELACAPLFPGTKVEVVARERIANAWWLKIAFNRPGCPQIGYIAEANTTLVAPLEEERVVETKEGVVNDEIVDEMKYLAGQGRAPRRSVLAQSRGLYRFPMLQESDYVSACGAFHYLPDENLVDIYIHKKVGCGFLNVLQKWNQEECAGNDQGCRIAFGDISHKTDPIWSGHRTHTSGQCMDIRPLRKGGFKNEAVWWCEWKGDDCSGVNPDYDREKTEAFVRFLQRNGATKLLFNDPVLLNKGLTRWASGHDNHIHACFYNNSSLNTICRNYQVDGNTCRLLSEGKMR